VLFNFKQLIFSLRWSSDFSHVYQFWLVNVVNDCFFFFLRKSEPVYAYHCLQLAEFFFRRMQDFSESQETDPHKETYMYVPVRE